MNIGEKNKETLWIISDARPVKLDLSNICQEPVSGAVREYGISELTRYLLNPNPITLEEKVVGCKVFYGNGSSGIMRGGKKKCARKNKNGAENDDPSVEEIVSPSRIGMPSFEDKNLNAHFMKINDMLRPYDPVQKKLAGLDRDRVEDIKALCEDIGRNRYQLNLQGSIQDKINFVTSSLSSKTRVVANKAYLLNGLFELRGFDFQRFNGMNSYRLIAFMQNGQDRYAVLNNNYQFEYWVDDSIIIRYMHLLEQCIQSDPKLREALTLCMNNKAKPLKLFFAKQLGQDYSGKYLPRIYKDVFSAYNIRQKEIDRLAEALNKSQSIISFNYVPLFGSGKHRLCTNISVMHDFQALEGIKSQLPQVYREIKKKASLSDAGKLYLLDSMRGYQNV